jgi:hypothetical protein
LQYFREKEDNDMAGWLWSGAVILTIAGGLLFWGARVLDVDGFYVDSSAILGLALVLVSLTQI